MGGDLSTTSACPSEFFPYPSFIYPSLTLLLSLLTKTRQWLPTLDFILADKKQQPTPVIGIWHEPQGIFVVSFLCVFF